MNVLLTTINSKYIHQNLAIGLLYELNKNYEGLAVKEFGLKTGTDEIAGYCSNYHLVAFSCYIWNILPTLETARKIKEINPECRILLGGPEVSFEFEEIITKPEIDFIIAGEGEIPFSALLKYYPEFNQVPGLVWKEGEAFIINKPLQIFNLQQLHGINPYLCIPPEELKYKICYIEASRGCPNCCEFCLASLDNGVRYLPLDTITTNLLYLMEHGRVIKFLDRTFNTNSAFAISIFQFILNHYKPGNIFQFEVKADILREDFVSFIRLHIPKGIFRFEIGIQTLNAKSNHEVNRRQDFEKIKTFISQVEDKIEVHLDLIVGLPYDYFDDIKYSFEEVFKLFAPELQLGFLKFLKGTPIRNNYQEHSYAFDPLPPYQVIESKYLSKDEIEKFAIVEHCLDIFWNKKRTLYTLRYVAQIYSVFDFLYGLGLYWKEKNGFRNTGILGIFDIIYEFSVKYFAGDKILHELIALDYYMQHKVKPGVRYLFEISRDERFEIFNSKSLNHHKYRYIIHRIHFSIQKFIYDGIIQPANDLLIIEYTGVNKPDIVL